jgi:hypothetical protein
MHDPTLMQPFDMDQGHVAEVARARGCSACGMRLVVPGIPREGGVYCCHGCERTVTGPGPLHRPENHRVAVARAVQIDETPERVAEFLSDINLLHLYEQKLTRIQTTAVSSDGRTACATADGQFMLLTYHIELHFDALEGGGYKSTLCDNGPVAGLRGTFAARPADRGGTVVTHQESYEFLGGTAGLAFGQLARPYLGWTIARELRTLKRLIEEPVVLANALRGGDPRKTTVDPSVVVWDPVHGDRPHRGLFPRVPTPNTIKLAGAFGLGALTAAAILVRLRRAR